MAIPLIGGIGDLNQSASLGIAASQHLADSMVNAGSAIGQNLALGVSIQEANQIIPAMRQNFINAYENLAADPNSQGGAEKIAQGMGSLMLTSSMAGNNPILQRIATEGFQSGGELLKSNFELARFGAMYGLRGDRLQDQNDAQLNKAGNDVITTKRMLDSDPTNTTFQQAYQAATQTYTQLQQRNQSRGNNASPLGSDGSSPQVNGQQPSPDASGVTASPVKPSIAPQNITLTQTPQNPDYSTDPAGNVYYTKDRSPVIIDPKNNTQLQYSDPNFESIARSAQATTSSASGGLIPPANPQTAAAPLPAAQPSPSASPTPTATPSPSPSVTPAPPVQAPVQTLNTGLANTNSAPVSPAILPAAQGNATTNAPLMAVPNPTATPSPSATPSASPVVTPAPTPSPIPNPSPQALPPPPSGMAAGPVATPDYSGAALRLNYAPKSTNSTSTFDSSGPSYKDETTPSKAPEEFLKLQQTYSDAASQIPIPAGNAINIWGLANGKVYANTQTGKNDDAIGATLQFQPTGYTKPFDLQIRDGNLKTPIIVKGNEAIKSINSINGAWQNLSGYNGDGASVSKIVKPVDNDTAQKLYTASLIPPYFPLGAGTFADPSGLKSLNIDPSKLKPADIATIGTNLWALNDALSDSNPDYAKAATTFTNPQAVSIFQDALKNSKLAPAVVLRTYLTPDVFIPSKDSISHVQNDDWVAQVAPFAAH